MGFTTWKDSYVHLQLFDSSFKCYLRLLKIKHYIMDIYLMGIVCGVNFCVDSVSIDSHF